MLETIISDIYAAAAGRKDWRVALHALATRLDLWAVQVIGVDKRRGAILFSSEGGPIPQQASLDYLRHYHQFNPRVGPTLALAGPDAWFHDQEHFDEEFIAHNPFYQDFLIPYGGCFGSFAKVIDNEDVIVVFGAVRGHGHQPLNAADVEVLSRLKFHLEQAMGNYLHLRTAYAEAGVGKQLLNEFRYPMILVDDRSGIWFRNHAGEAALARADYIYDSAGSLRCRNLEDGNELLVAIRSLNLQSEEGGINLRDRVFVRLRKACDAYPVAAFVIAVRPKAVLGAFGHAPLALIIFHDPNVERELDPFIVAETFGLTPAESRIAVNLVKGFSIREMADQIGISPTTVKSQLQSIYTKTGTNRQADLCLLLTRTLDITGAGIGVTRP